MLFAIKDGLIKFVEVSTITEMDIHTDDGHGLKIDCFCLLQQFLFWTMILDDHVGIRSSKTKGVDSRLFVFIRPFLRFQDHLIFTHPSIIGLYGFLQIDVGRDDTFLH